MSDKQMTALLDRVAKLEAEVEQLKSGNHCGEGLLGLFGSQKDNPFFDDVIAHINAERVADMAAVDASLAREPKAKRRSSKRNTAAKKTK